MSTSNRAFVIVGASLAGAKAAETLREEGFDGGPVLIGNEPELPYERPPLTKDYLRGESPREKTYVHPEGYYQEHGIELMSTTAVTAIDPARSQVTRGDGAELAFDRLLLAIGAEPRRISIPGADLDGVRYLRTLADCDILRGDLETGGRAVGVGGLDRRRVRRFGTPARLRGDRDRPGVGPAGASSWQGARQLLLAGDPRGKRPTRVGRYPAAGGR